MPPLPATPSPDKGPRPAASGASVIVCGNVFDGRDLVLAEVHDRGNTLVRSAARLPAMSTVHRAHPKEMGNMLQDDMEVEDVRICGVSGFQEFARLRTDTYQCTAD